MRVLKFGGTSVGDAEAIRRVTAIVAGTRGARVVVVSALAGATDRLLEAAALACADRAAADAMVDGLAERHHGIARGIRQAHLRALTDAGIDGIAASAHAAVAAIADAGAPRPTPALSDRIVALGEVWSSRLVAALFEDAGIAARWVDARHVVRTNRRYSAAVPDPSATADGVDRHVRPALAFDRVVVTGGFIGSAPDGSTTTLGRGGSDYSAALLGACLSAEEIQIWTDVDGVLTADPRLIAHARPIERLSYDEAHDLATFGAKVLHPATIQPAAARGIPVRVLNSHRPDAPGTLIASDAAQIPGEGATAVSCRRGLAVAEIVARDPNAAESFAAAVFQELAAKGTPVVLADLCGPRLSIAIDAATDMDAVRATLGASAEVRVRHGFAAVCAVGRGWGHSAGFIREAFAVLGDTPVHLVARPSATSPLAVVVDEEHALAAMTRLHDGFLAVVEEARAS